MRPRWLSAVPAAALLAACSAFPGAAPAPLPTVALGGGEPAPQATRAPRAAPSGSGVVASGVVASGVVVPAQEARLAFAAGERIRAVRVAVGDQVSAGQPLVELDDEAAQAQAAQARAALAAAQAGYDLLSSGPTAEELRQAEAAVLIASASYSRTVGGARRADITAAQAALAAAEAAYQKVKAGPQEQDVALARANLMTAEAALKQAQSAYDEAYRRDPAGIGGHPAALALEQATNAWRAAQAVYDSAAQPPDEARLAAAWQQVEGARAALARARSPATDYDIAQARAQVEQAQAQLDGLRAGPRAQQLEAARSQVAAAQAQLQASEAQLRKLTLTAPFAGTVSKLDARVGEWVGPGQPVLVLADLARWRVETTDLSERDVARVAVGQPVVVLIEALNAEAAGRVSVVSPLADTLGGDVVYQTVIDLDSAPPGLRAGMTVEARFGAQP